MFKIIKEDYGTISIALKEIIEELQNFRELLINGIEYNIKYTLGGDLKWLAIVTGINAANSDQPCPWCKFNNAHGVNLIKKIMMTLKKAGLLVIDLMKNQKQIKIHLVIKIKHYLNL